MDIVTKMAAERPLVIFSKSSCCMSHTIRTLFHELGVNPAVYELDEIPRGPEIELALSKMGCNPTAPTLFIGGKLFGGAKEVLIAHINSSLKPLLHDAGALWT